jgi:protease-4
MSLLAILLVIGTSLWGMSQISGALNAGQRMKPSLVAGHFIGHVRLEGPIDAEAMDLVIDDIDSFADMENARAIFLEVNSPGGTVVASQELFNRIRELRKKKPVLAYYRDVAASGAYYGTASASWIVANRGTLVGSIGVIMQNLVLKDLLEWAHLRPYTLKTGDLKDAGSPLREASPADNEYLSKLLKDTHGQFMDDVFSGRRTVDRQTDLSTALGSPSPDAPAPGPDSNATGVPGLPPGVPTLTEVSPSAMDIMKDGRVVLGTEAVGLGLVDAVGSKAAAVNQLRSALKNDKLRLEEFGKEQDFEMLMKRYFGQAALHFSNAVRESIREALVSEGTAPIQAR